MTKKGALKLAACLLGVMVLGLALPLTAAAKQAGSPAENSTTSSEVKLHEADHHSPNQVQTPAQDEEKITVYVTEKGKRYHKEGCRFLSKSKKAISLKEAKAKGYKPCRICKPPE